jgi:putative transposase
MARPLRLEFDGAVYHVTSRGNDRESIFFDEADRLRFLEILADVVARYGWLCHAYCLMTNHYHLLIETPEAGLSRGMQLLNGVYTQYVNRTHKRVGHLLQGRFKAILVEKDSHLLELARYVVLNPVRAKMVRRIDGWRWSSYRATAGQEDVPAFLTVDWLLAQFGSDRPRAIQEYRRFVRRGKGIDIWDGLRGGYILGSERYVGELRPLLDGSKRGSEIRKSERFVARPDLAELFVDVADKTDRNARIYDAVRVHRYALSEVGDHVGLLYSTVSMIAKRQHELRQQSEK